MAKHRNSLQIIAEILSIVEIEPKKTHIMYQANLSYSLVCRYLNRVLDSGLIKKKENTYFLTQKGQIFLNEYSEYIKNYKQINNQLNELESTKKELKTFIGL